MKHEIRFAIPADSEEILAIYAPYVTQTAISFETEAPALQAFSDRIAAITQQYPYLVYTVDGRIVGYAYATRYRERSAYRFGVETSVYIASDYHGAGVARRLYGCVFALLARQGYKTAYAGYSEPNEKSRKFHTKFGFHAMGTDRSSGYKLGAWHDVTWLQMQIGEYDAVPAEPVPVTAIPAEEAAAIFAEHMK